MNPVRSFIALNIENPEINRLRIIQERVKSELTDYKVKWENPFKFHLTLRFLGDVEEKLLSGISTELGSIEAGFDNIILSTDGIGFFPDKKHPNVVFINFTDTDSRAAFIAEEIEKKLKISGFKPEKKFIPHITLGRFRRDNKKRIEDNFKIDVEPFQIILSSFYMMKSVLKPSGSVYEVLKEYKFK